MKKLLLILVISFCFSSDLTLMFWNVENLFDQVDDKEKKDEDFLPAGNKRYTWRSYCLKNEHLAEVINKANPDCLAMVEVENHTVLENLKRSLKHHEMWEIIIDDGPDLRGIDPALMYRRDKFQYCSKQYFPIYFKDRDYHSRPIMRVDLCELQTKDTLSIFINHWPSRRGGKQTSDPYRIYAADILIEAMRSTLEEHPEYSLIITGDFNDDREDDCLRMVEDLSWVDYLVKELPKGVKGTYYYEGEWIHFDHFLVSNFEQSNIIIENAEIFAPHWIREKPSQGPLRFYKGIETLGGYSDHYSILLNLTFKGKVVE
ncbi:MAG: hypothetical protein WCT23_02640 [Candidatus Neomarinimicrobiota bacterium]|jgi:hypothetical protein